MQTSQAVAQACDLCTAGMAARKMTSRLTCCSFAALQAGASTQCKQIAKKYTFAGPVYQPSSCAPKQPRPAGDYTMYLTVTPDCRAKIDQLITSPSTGKQEVTYTDTVDLMPAVAEVPCFGVHFTVPAFGTTGDYLFEIDSHGEMRQHTMMDWCCRPCLPSIGCVSVWKTSDWPDCTWALRMHQVNSKIKNVFGKCNY